MDEKGGGKIRMAPRYCMFVSLSFEAASLSYKSLNPCIARILATPRIPSIVSSSTALQMASAIVSTCIGGMVKREAKEVKGGGMLVGSFDGVER